MKMKTIAIYGHGGFGREVRAHLLDSIPSHCIKFFVDETLIENNSENVLPLQELLNHIDDYEVLVAVGDPKARNAMVNKLPSNTHFYTYIDPSAKILEPETVSIGEGSIICAGCILTTNIHLGKHTQLNLGTTVGHDVIADDYFTTAPMVNISGNCEFGEHVYFGTNSCIREKTKICSDVTIGMNAGVVKNINESGIYVGTPAKKNN